MTERFPLWGIGIACSTAIGVTGTVFTLASIDQNGPAYQGAIGPLGLAAAAALWLALFPPRADTGHVLARSAAA